MKAKDIRRNYKSYYGWAKWIKRHLLRTKAKNRESEKEIHAPAEAVTEFCIDDD